MDHASNPYSPPASGRADPSETAAWKIIPPHLYFRDGAQLPPVNLFPSNASLPPIPHSHTFQISVFTQKILPLAIVFLGLLYGFSIVSPHPFMRPLKGFFPSIVIGLLLASPWFPKARFRLSWHASPTPHINLYRRLANITFYLILGVILFHPQIRQLSPSLAFSPTLLLFPLGIALIGLRLLSRPRLRPLRREGEWLVTSGIPDDSLLQLAALQPQATSPNSHRQAVIHDVYAYRLPLHALIENEWWNLIRVLSILILKLSRSRHLILPRFSILESRSIPTSNLHPRFAAKVHPILNSPEFSPWTPVNATQLDHPHGTLLTHTLTLLSPDHTTLLTLVYVQGANQSVHYELFETTFRTPLADHTTLITSNRPSYFTSLPDHHFAYRKSSPALLAQHHFQRLTHSHAQAQPFPPDSSFSDYLLQESIRRDQLWIQNGYMSPGRETFTLNHQKIAESRNGNS